MILLNYACHIYSGKRENSKHYLETVVQFVRDIFNMQLFFPFVLCLPLLDNLHHCGGPSEIILRPVMHHCMSLYNIVHVASPGQGGKFTLTVH